MNTIEHIKAEHYATDDKGRALVPTCDHRTYCVLSTDHPGELPIVGYCIGTPETISRQSADGHFLLPPPPRKVKVTKYAVALTPSLMSCLIYDSREDAARAHLANRQIIELTGEYEEPWS